MARVTNADIATALMAINSRLETLEGASVTVAPAAPVAAKAAKPKRASFVSEKLPALSRWDNGVKAGNTFTYTPKRDGASSREYVAISEAEAVAYVKACVKAGYTFALPVPSDD